MNLISKHCFYFENIWPKDVYYYVIIKSKELNPLFSFTNFWVEDIPIKISYLINLMNQLMIIHDNSIEHFNISIEDYKIAQNGDVFIDCYYDFSKTNRSSIITNNILNDLIVLKSYLIDQINVLLNTEGISQSFIDFGKEFSRSFDLFLTQFQSGFNFSIDNFIQNLLSIKYDYEKKTLI